MPYRWLILKCDTSLESSAQALIDIYIDLYSSVIHCLNCQHKPYWFPLRKNRVNKYLKSCSLSLSLSLHWSAVVLLLWIELDLEECPILFELWLAAITWVDNGCSHWWHFSNITTHYWHYTNIENIDFHRLLMRTRTVS